jgi:CheY-like chemotaxis protein
MSETTASAARGRVLVVEDEEIVRQLLTGLLREEGYDVDAVPRARRPCAHSTASSTTSCCST